ncbi:hypothetical protein DNU06_03225 [Putridiphycobacter roseus]|uniref:histidine kinase n=1 Tax=Putridiphycobacter roseus TaxID=2219161 RepID=A0A2W1NH55_9FLAO|nr:HAMP domain-containing sensor histidine kinase [Putridiphycobacter roseus]PZE18855.1 hypothetical protein DNU06_03225 [Putridiphycobacter roseus]
MRKKNQLKFILTLSLGLILWLTGYYLYNYKVEQRFSLNEVVALERTIQEEEVKLNESFNNFVDRISLKEAKENLFVHAKKHTEATKYDVFIYKDNKLYVWTNNRVALPLFVDNDFLETKILHLPNGWYFLKKRKRANFIICSVFLIKQEFPYENKDLVNGFSSKIDQNLNATLSNQVGKYNITNKKGTFLFSIQPTLQSQTHVGYEILTFSCYLISFFILLQLLISSSQILLIRKPTLLIIFPLAIILLRIFSIQNSWFASMDKFEMFNPELFASSRLIPSLGDLIINVFIFYFLVIFLQKRTRNWFANGNKKLKLALFVIPLALMSFYVAFQINHIIYALVYDSKINFDLEHLFDLNIYSLISIGLIGFCFYTYFKFIQYLAGQLKKLNFALNIIAICWFLCSAAFCVFDQIQFEHSLLTSMWPVILSGMLLWFEFRNTKYKFVHIISLLAFVSFYAAYILEDYSNHKEREVRQIYAEKIAEDEDPIAEYEYDQIEKEIRRDKFLEAYLVNDFEETKFTDDIEASYFNNLRQKYDLSYHLFNANKEKRSKPGAIPTVGYEKLDFIVDHSSLASSINPHIYFIKTNVDKLSYLVNYPILQDKDTLGYLVIEFRSKKLPKEIGLPSVLLENDGFSNAELKNYSIAKYVDELLVNNIGDYDYPFVPNLWRLSPNRFSTLDGYSHYVYTHTPDRITVISKKKSTIISAFTTFSYLLIFYGFILLMINLYKYLNNNKITFRNLSLNFKFQSVLVGLILLTLVSFGVGAGTYVVQQYYLNSQVLIKEKAGSVETELEHKFSAEDDITFDKPYLEYLLKKFSRVFVTDINLFDLNGSLLASSQPKIYSRGLISKKMNSTAYYAFDIEKRSEFIHQEKIGELEFLSAYRPFVNAKGELLAYLNIQYISKQDELENQISGFLLAIINIMVLMLAISTLIAIVVSNRLTSPLKYIQSSLKGMQLGAKNKPIYYRGNDEIGDLVKEYNRKVNELENYAEQLAKSERESAWREMAKQVAHEIKNPLTPMKLSIQHMKRSIQVADEASEEKLKRVTTSLIEQIDALTKIANEFSNFAKMPKANEESVNLAEILQSVNAVFADGNKAYQLYFKNELDHAPIIWADKNLTLRVFNNLIKNALQAIPSDKEGRVIILLSEVKEEYLVTIIDNGVGIDETAKAKMFIPYFTTKSTGTGLGLAMSKQIIENMNGKIWFESELGVGTRFFVSFSKKK